MKITKRLGKVHIMVCFLFQPSSKPVFVQNADELVSDSANIFVESQEKLIILLVLLVLAGLAFEGYQRYRRKKGNTSSLYT